MRLASLCILFGVASCLQNENGAENPEYEYVVVGSGPGGGILAYVLSDPLQLCEAAQPLTTAVLTLPARVTLSS